MTEAPAGNGARDQTGGWGRIAEDGTVYVRDDAAPDGSGERVIGSWYAGTEAEGMAFYQLKYDDLAAEVRLLEGRIGMPGSDARAIGASARKLLQGLPEAAVIGDIGALRAHLEDVLTRVDARRAEAAEAKAAAAAEAVTRKQALVEEAKALSASDSWRVGSERYRALVEQWKTIRGVDRATDSALWEQFAAARREFDRRRRAAAAAAETERAATAERKEALIRQAEKISTSTDWGDTARRFRDLMRDWKAAGRAGREADEALWVRFKAAQDTFFTARTAAFSARDDEQKANLSAKQALLTEAEGIDVSSGPDAARRQLRRLQERWDAIGRVPRDAMGDIEKRFIAVEDRMREAANAGRPVVKSESPLVIRLRESVGKLENRLARAQAAGDTRLAEETETSLETQRAWLAQAESST